ncbi:MAG: NUDIX domain-containing protein, partial [Culicoidibacterales bacterium]
TINHENQILITKRHFAKKHGGLWECSGGAAQRGENSITSALRELSEETGIHIQSDELVLLHSQKIIERFVDTYITKQTITLADIILQKEEVIDARFVTFAELVSLWENGLLVPRERFGIYKNRIAQFIASHSE